MPHTTDSAEARSALIALISTTAGSPTGAALCRRLLKTAVAIVLDEPEERPPQALTAASRAASELAALLGMAAEHAEALAAHADTLMPRPFHQRPSAD